MENYILEVDGLKKNYGDTAVLKGISFEVRRGEVYGFLGPNGAGKTTTLECVEGIKRYDGGRILVDGIDPSRNGKELRKKVGVQLQASSLPAGILVKEAMELVSTWHNVNFGEQLMCNFGLDKIERKQYSQLSTGQKRRLHLALALVHHPEIVILDEPTAGLDAEGRAQLHNEIRMMKERNVTILLSTHDMAEAEELCDRISIIIKGKIILTGTPKEIVGTSTHKTKIAIKTKRKCIKPNDNFRGLRYYENRNDFCVWTCRDIAAGINELMGKIIEEGDRVVDLRIEQPSLGERFLELIGKGV